MFLIIYLTFILLNARISFDILLLGLPITFGIYYFSYKFLDYSIKIDLIILKLSPLIIVYSLFATLEVIRANLYMIGLILNPKKHTKSLVFPINIGLKTQLARVVYANTISLMPGLVTLSLKEDKIWVHSIDNKIKKFPNKRLLSLLNLMERMSNYE